VNTGLFIRGGWDRSVRRGKCYTGLPSRRPLDGGPFFFRFWIDNRLIAYEWAMVLADHHPYLPWFGDLKGKTTEDMQKRESRLVSETAWAIYHELEAEFEARRLSPLRREFCADEPRMLDFTRCVFGLDQVLTLIRRRGDTGWLIGKLLARYPTANDAAHGAAPLGETLKPGPGPKGGEQSVNQLAWEIAEQFLNCPVQRPAAGRGRLMTLARMVNHELENQGHKRQDDSIRKAIGPSLRDWEAGNPAK
jgi:hypothetical protein